VLQAIAAPFLMGGGGDDDVEDVVQLDPNAAVQSAKELLQWTR
jgi:hypothetical protein